MASQFQIRKALGKLSNVADFLRRYPHISERTVYRQRSPEHTRMHTSVASDIEAALIKEGLLRDQTQASATTRRTAARKVARRNASLVR